MREHIDEINDPKQFGEILAFAKMIDEGQMAPTIEYTVRNPKAMFPLMEAYMRKHATPQDKELFKKGIASVRENKEAVIAEILKQIETGTTGENASFSDLAKGDGFYAMLASATLAGAALAAPTGKLLNMILGAVVGAAASVLVLAEASAREPQAIARIITKQIEALNELANRI